MPEPTHVPLRNLYRLSVSRNIYALIVNPLTELLYGETPTHQQLKDIKSELTELHKCFWNVNGPMAYPGAVAGRFEELLYPLRHATKGDGRSIKIGAEGKAGQTKVGGDVTVVKTDGRTITYQLKVANSAKAENLIEHINKAGAQLTGQTGEMPKHGSECVIYLLVQNTEAFEAYTLEQWKVVVDAALNKDYTSDNRIVTSASIKSAVTGVKIYTRKARFKLKIINGVVDLTFSAAKEASASKYFAYTGTGLERHWVFLTQWFNEKIAVKENAEKQKCVNATKQNGVKGTADAWQHLPMQSGQI